MSTQFDDSPDQVMVQRLRALLAKVAAQLTQEQQVEITTLIDVGEPTVALESIGGALCDRNIVVDLDTLAEIEVLGEVLGADASFWIGLNAR